MVSANDMLVLFDLDKLGSYKPLGAFTCILTHATFHQSIQRLTLQSVSYHQGQVPRKHKVVVNFV